MKPCPYCLAMNGDCKAMVLHLKHKIDNGVVSFDTKAEVAWFVNTKESLGGVLAEASASSVESGFTRDGKVL